VSEIAISTKQARAFLSHSRRVGASTLRAAAGAIDQRREALLRERQAEAREMRDRVRASSLVQLPAQLVDAFQAGGSGGAEGGGAGGGAAGGGGSASARVARTYRALENPHSVLATTRTPRPSSARCGERTERCGERTERTDRSVTWAPSPARRGAATAGDEEESSSKGYYDC
jgi:hypothetical protein